MKEVDMTLCKKLISLTIMTNDVHKKMKDSENAPPNQPVVHDTTKLAFGICLVGHSGATSEGAKQQAACTGNDGWLFENRKNPTNTKNECVHISS